MCARDLCGSDNFIIACIESSIADILAHRPGKEMRGLQNDSDFRMNRLHGVFGVVSAVDTDYAGARLVKAAE